MEIIVSGSPREIDFVKTICSAKVRRGKLHISPITALHEKQSEDEVYDEDETAAVTDGVKETYSSDEKYPHHQDSKDISAVDTKGRKRKDKKVRD